MQSKTQNIGTAHVGFSFVEKIEYQVLNLKSIVLSDEYKMPVFSLNCGPLRLHNQQLKNLSQYEYTHPHNILIFSENPITLELNEKSTSLGLVNLSQL